MNHFSIDFAIPWWIALPIILFGSLLAWWTYRRTLPPVSKSRRWTLTILRTVGLTLLLLAMFDLVFRNQTIDQVPPIALLGIDNSESMSLPGIDSSRIQEATRFLEEFRNHPAGSHAFEFSLSDSALPLSTTDVSDLNASGPLTNLGDLFRVASDSIALHNIQAIVLATDGRYNTGRNPAFDAERLGIPVYVLGLGDSVDPRDLAVDDIFTNEIGFVNVSQPVQVRLRSRGFNQAACRVVLLDDRGEVARREIQLPGGDQDLIASFDWKPNTEGYSRLTARVEPLPGELTTANNSRTLIVKVRSNRRRYVLISGSPNPDYAFMKRRLQAIDQIELTSLVQTGGASYLGGTLSSTLLNTAQTLVMIDFPTVSTSQASLDLITDALRRRGIPVMMILGPDIDYEKLRRLEGILPVTIGTVRSNEIEVFTELTPVGRQHPVMATGDSAAWSSLPPIFRNETTITANGNAEVLAVARLGTSTLAEPMIVAGRSGRSRSLFVAGYGIWRWDLIGEGRRDVTGATPLNILDHFASSTMRWLGISEDEQQVRIRTDKQIYNQGEAVRFHAQVYDQSFEPVENAIVDLTVTGGRGTQQLQLASIGGGRYEGILNDLPNGDYRFSGSATERGQSLGSDNGRFVVDRIGVEYTRTSMNAPFLRSLAERTGGRFYTFDQRQQLLNDILENERFVPRSLEHVTEEGVRELLWFLLLSLLAFSSEWFLRKQSGML